MLDDFLDYIDQESLFEKEDKILLTISGGIDSMVMAELFRMSGLKFSIAHCNFQLRENESDQDEIFVNSYAKNFEIECFSKSFDTIAYSKEKKTSIQMAARDLRYEWFEEIRKKHKFNYIATAHHLDDQAETVFINLCRGTGIAGLHGILPKKANLIRPLLFATRNDIVAFAEQQNIDYREDSSNASDKYMRNYIRHHILPEFHHLNQNFSKSLAKSIERVRKVEEVFKDTVRNTMNNMLDLQGDKIIIDIEELMTIKNLDVYLYEFLGLYNFNETHISDLIKSLDQEQSGLQFYSSSHRIIKDRKRILLVPFEDDAKPETEYFEIQDSYTEISKPIHLKFNNLKDHLQIEKDPKVGQFDLEKLEFPLYLRRWKEGDFFYPLGMQNKKKLSDYFIDNKISVYDKEESWLLCSGNDIIWVVGHRMDDRFKVTDKTKQIFRAEFSNGTH
jgi:tRNA(Ile)-lysidine synthase